MVSVDIKHHNNLMANTFSYILRVHNKLCILEYTFYMDHDQYSPTHYKADLVFGVRLIISKCACMLYASGKLSLVVLTTEKGDAFAFDVKKHPDIMYQGLGRMLQSVHVLKVKWSFTLVQESYFGG